MSIDRELVFRCARDAGFNLSMLMSFMGSLCKIIEAYEAAKAPTTDDLYERYGRWGIKPDEVRHMIAQQPDEFTLLGVLADIRQKTGLGDKVMLSDLADTLSALIQNGDSAIDTNKRLTKRLLEREAHQPVDYDDAIIQHCAEAFHQNAGVKAGDIYKGIRATLECYDRLRKPERESIEQDAQRYRWLRGRDLDTISKGGVFAGMTPDNMVLNEEDLDQAVDEAIIRENARQG